MKQKQHQPLDARSKHLRHLVLTMIDAARRGHIGSAYSLMEIVRVLYDDILHVSPTQPRHPDRDRFILSKGNGCLGLYAILADKGFFDRSCLATFCQHDGLLGGHPEPTIPGVEVATGSLGHGLSLGIGMAHAARIDRRSYRTYVVVGDGECNEGSIWEAALSAGNRHLDTLTVLVDYNHMQSYGTTQEVANPEPFAAKWQSFNWAVEEIDGHDVAMLQKTLTRLPRTSGKPTCIICHTVKGKGIAMIENNPAWHHKRGITNEEMNQLKRQLDEY